MQLNSTVFIHKPVTISPNLTPTNTQNKDKTEPGKCNKSNIARNKKNKSFTSAAFNALKVNTHRILNSFIRYKLFVTVLFRQNLTATTTDFNRQ